ncbi:hypothetical protein BG000_002085 [Podila horticola]|nr:hypothetical protein BG000_002085 [Podila horticola]
MPAPKPTRQFVPLPGQEFATPVPPIHKLPVDEYGKVTMPTTAEELEAISKPSVLISGGGIGGLTLAILLHKASIPFLVLERAKEIKPLGSGMSMGGHISPLFKQLGIYDEFVKRGKEYNVMNMLTENLDVVNIVEFDWLRTAVGYPEYLISRPELYDLLWNQIPRDRIILGKRILSFDQNEDSVMVRCSDNSSYHGDILVGADGAYSAVRQNLYRSLKESSKLPSGDNVALPFSCVCLVGQTVPLDPEEFPHMKEKLAQFNSVLGTSTMCTHSSKRNDSFRNSEWGPEAAEALAREVRVFKVPGGKDGKVLTLGEYVDRTPQGTMSKVMLEEIVFDTWYGGRTVLLGDGKQSALCVLFSKSQRRSKNMNPTGGQGAVNAMHDAVALANWLSTLRLADVEYVEKVFKEYRNERFPVVKDAFESSQMFTKNLGKNLMASIVRGMIKRIPLWLWKRMIYKVNTARSQVSFLPLVEDKAKVGPLYQSSLHKTLAIHQALAKPAVVATGSSAPVTV